MTEKQLADAEARYRRASRRADDLRARRDATIREALRAGWTHARVSDATGLTRGRIGQIASNNPTKE